MSEAVKTTQKQETQFPINEFTCMTCRNHTSEGLSLVQFKSHLLTVHGVTPDKIKGTKQGIAFMDFRGWYSQTYVWKLEESGVEFRQYYANKKHR